MPLSNGTRTSLILSGCLLWLLACSPTHTESWLNSRGGDTSSEETLEPTEMDWNGVFATVFQPRCTRCHSEFNSYETVLRDIRRIEEEVRTNRMPEGAPLSQEEKNLLFNWIEQGAPM